MEARVLVGCIGLVSAFIAGQYAVDWFVASWRGRLSVLGETISVRALLSWYLRNGVSFAAPAVHALLRHRRIEYAFEELAVYCENKSITTTKEALASCVLAGSALLALLFSLLSGNVICLVVAPLLVIVAIAGFLGSLHDKQKENIQEALPLVLESMSACFSAGYTLLQTFRQVAKDVPGAAGRLFLSAAHVLETGGSAHEALEVLRQSDIEEIPFIAVALDIQHQAGGSIRQVLDAASDSVKGELALKKSLRVQTAQARLSARIVSIMPLLLVTLFSLISPTFLQPFFQSVFGIALLVLAIVMQIAGIILVRRALSVGGMQ